MEIGEGIPMGYREVDIGRWMIRMIQMQMKMTIIR